MEKIIKKNKGGRKKGSHLNEEHKRKLSLAKIGCTGELANNWHGGKSKIGNYIYIHSPFHPNKNQRGYVLEHRLVMEKYIGRFLTKREVVHHINENTHDNNIENLELFSNSGLHLITHHIIRDKNNGRFKRK